MGAFWIFAAILTFVYIVYYAVIMAMDTVGDKGKKKKDVEVFAVGNSSQEAFVEGPTIIKERKPCQTPLRRNKKPPHRKPPSKSLPSRQRKAART